MSCPDCEKGADAFFRQMDRSRTHQRLLQAEANRWRVAFITAAGALVLLSAGLLVWAAFS